MNIKISKVSTPHSVHLHDSDNAYCIKINTLMWRYFWSSGLKKSGKTSMLSLSLTLIYLLNLITDQHCPPLHSTIVACIISASELRTDHPRFQAVTEEPYHACMIVVVLHLSYCTHSAELTQWPWTSNWGLGYKNSITTFTFKSLTSAIANSPNLLT